MSRNAQPKFKNRFIAALSSGLLTLGFVQAHAAAPLPNPGPSPRARVIEICSADATDAFQARPQVVKPMVDRAIMALTGKTKLADAWRSIVSTQEVVGLKVYSVPGPNSGTRKAVVAGVIEGLLTAGFSPKHIIVWDKQVTDLRLAGFFDLAERYGVRVAGSAQAGYDQNAFYESPLIGNLVWGDLEFGRQGAGIGRKSFISKLLTKEITKIINITPLLNHNYAGVSGNLYGLAVGSVDNTARFETDPARLAIAIPEIYAKPELSDRVVLNIVDALICQYEGEERGLLHYSAILNQLRLSYDPVALDVLSIQELERLRKTAGVPNVNTNMDLYSNAALLELGTNDPRRIAVESLGFQ